MKKPKKPLTERFQQLAGIKPLYELEDASPGASGPGKKPQKDIERVKNEVYVGGSYAIAKNIIEFSKSVDVYSAGNIDSNLN